MEVCWQFDYEIDLPKLKNLYAKAKQHQWDADQALDWDQEIDPSKPLIDESQFRFRELSILQRMSKTQRETFTAHATAQLLSQFLHGEQGALLCTAKIVETVPWYDAKLYASTQTMDEARHVEVFHRYIDEKLGGGFQVNAHLRMLLDDIIEDSRWDMTYLGMQVMVEGLALAAFGFMHQMTEEPLLKQLLRYVMSDEARHVAFGVLSLREVYEGMTDAEIKDRQEFAYEAAVRMRDRFLSQEVWQRFGVNPKEVVPLVLRDPNREVFQQLLFSKIVPNCKKLGLLDRNGAWLRRRYEEMGVIQFEDWADTGEEYTAFALDAEAPAA
jgi:hypothetical protein